MVVFGNPPEKNLVALSYPGVSGSRFNPLEANRIWGECVHKEKEARYVHGLLDAHDKLGLDEKWGKDASRRNGLLPDYESLQEVYRRLGWKVSSLGKVIPPDPHKIIGRRRKSCRSSSKHRRNKLQASPSEGRFFDSAVPAATPNVNSAYIEPSRPQSVQDKTFARGKVSKSRLKEKVAAAVHTALEQEFAVLSSLADMTAKPAHKSPQVLGAQYKPLNDGSLRRHASAPTLSTAKRALERAKGGG